MNTENVIIIDHIGLIDPQRKLTDKQKEVIHEITDHITKIRLNK